MSIRVIDMTILVEQTDGLLVRVNPKPLGERSVEREREREREISGFGQICSKGSDKSALESNFRDVSVRAGLPVR